MVSQKTSSACGTSGSREIRDGAVRDERAARLQAGEVGTINAPLSVAQSGTRCRTACAPTGVGGEAHAVRVSAVDGDAGARRRGSKSQTGLSIVSGGRLGDAHSAAKADLLERDGDQAGGDQAESTLVDGLCERLCKWVKSDSHVDVGG